MQLEFLGTAGYHPSETRHTSCVLLPEAASEHAFVLDAGSGFFRMADRSLPANLHIFLSHPHLDHVLGLTFLTDVLYRHPGCEVALYGDARTLQAVKQTLFASPLFPLALSCRSVEMQPRLPIQVAGVQVDSHRLTHPGGSLAYRFEWPDGKTLCYVTDTAGDAAYHEFIQGAPDLLIHERNFSDAYPELAATSGHCTSAHLVAAARFSGARQVVATHFNPLTTSDPLEEDGLRAQLPGLLGAFDGLKVDF